MTILRNLTRTIILKASTNPGVERTIRGSRLFRPLVSRFIAGSTIEEAISRCNELNKAGFFVTLDFLGESAQTVAEAREASNTFGLILDELHKLSTPDGSVEQNNLSLKLSQCGLEFDYELARNILNEAAAKAEATNSFVRVDMEDSRWTEATINLVDEVARTYPSRVGTVLQSSLRRTGWDLRGEVNSCRRVRLVKGAYYEFRKVAFGTKSDVDQQYLNQAFFLLKAGVYPAFATHDNSMIREIKAIASLLGVDKKCFEFQMLLGIRKDLQQKLIDEGYSVRIYVPFGDRWFPYFMRRLAERPANLWFLLRSLFQK